MRRITYMRDSVVALFCALLWIPIASGQQPSATGTPQPVAGPVHFYFCASNQIGVGHTAYISNIFAVSKQNSPPIENEYLGFLKKTYSYPANQTSCFDGFLTQEAVRAARQTRIEQFEQIKDKVVETPWTYSAALSDSEIHAQPTRVSPPPAPSSRVQEAAPEAAPVTASTPAAPTAAGVGTPSALGQRAGFHTKEIAGVYDGRLQCTSAQHETNFKLSLTATGEGTLTGMLTFDAQDDSGTHAVTYSLKGTNASAAFQVFPVKWETAAPARHMVMTRSGAYDVNSWFGLNGLYDSSGTISGIELGIVINPACTFSAKRSEAASASIDPRIPAQKEGTAASLPPGTRYYYCSGVSSTNIYFSDIFTAPAAININIVRDDFRQFLMEKYSLQRNEMSAGCGLGGKSGMSMEESNSAKADLAERNSQRKPIETGWKPKTLPPVENRH